ncbi:hypothetical protein K432DRAFT_444408 [Lepidopterella palustris CBS 459.81]|uniref:Uncharacterized protein n=1 Tax=Lepidopterella palustris CBS 459.81 TaxID=1314670 RepID=A0A8E2E7M3_9PEZI|nr:hypothetical protein K432DRAFT_444408 [Lepidopterella palustris CBS 459.81]
MYPSQVVESACDSFGILLSIVVASASTQYDIQVHERRRLHVRERLIDSVHHTKAAATGCDHWSRPFGYGDANSRPLFWKLQRWIMSAISQLLGHARVPEAILNPSTRAVFSGWLLLALGCTAFYQLHEHDRYQNIFIVGSIIAAAMIGMLESSGGDTIILTNMPWCITLGLVLSGTVHGLVRRTTPSVKNACVSDQIEHDSNISIRQKNACGSRRTPDHTRE